MPQHPVARFTSLALCAAHRSMATSLSSLQARPTNCWLGSSPAVPEVRARLVPADKGAFWAVQTRPRSSTARQMICNLGLMLLALLMLSICRKALAKRLTWARHAKVRAGMIFAERRIRPCPSGQGTTALQNPREHQCMSRSERALNTNLEHEVRGKSAHLSNAGLPLRSSKQALTSPSASTLVNPSKTSIPSAA